MGRSRALLGRGGRRVRTGVRRPAAGRSPGPAGSPGSYRTGGIGVLITRRLGHEPALATDDAARALATHDWARPDGALFGYFPVSRGNPFQDMLYSRLRPAGLTPFP